MVRIYISGPHLYSAFIESAFQCCLTFTHSCTHRQLSQPRRATVGSSGAIRVRSPAQGHHDIQLGGAEGRTSNLAVTSQPALPPELMPPR